MPQDPTYIDACTIIERVEECDPALDALLAHEDDEVKGYAVTLQNKIRNGADAILALALAIRQRHQQ